MELGKMRFEDIHSLSTQLGPEYLPQLKMLNFYDVESARERQAKSLLSMPLEEDHLVLGRKHVGTRFGEGVLVYVQRVPRGTGVKDTSNLGYDIYWATSKVKLALMVRTSSMKFRGIEILDVPFKFYVSEIASFTKHDGQVIKYPSVVVRNWTNE